MAIKTSVEKRYPILPSYKYVNDESVIMKLND